MATMQTDKAFRLNLNVASGSLAALLLAISTVLVSILAARFPSRTDYYAQQMTCRLYYNQGAPNEIECLSRWCANAANWPFARCNVTQGLKDEGYDPYYNRAYLSENFPFDKSSMSLSWASMSLITITLVLEVITQLLDMIKPKKKSFSYSKRYRVFLHACCATSWISSAVAEALLIYGSSKTSETWGLYNTTEGLWMAAAVISGLAFLSSSLFHYLRHRHLRYIKTAPVSGNLDTRQGESVLQHAKQPMDQLVSSRDQAAIGVTGSVSGSPISSNLTPNAEASTTAGFVHAAAGHRVSSDPSQQKMKSKGTDFSLEELQQATLNFSVKNLLGRGGFGEVYKGVLAGGQTVAVKRIHRHKLLHGRDEFKSEVEILSRVHHRNLVRILGYHIGETEELIVFEFMANGSLDHHLHGNTCTPIGWERRLQMAIDAAKGLAYLHHDCYPKVVHRDIKASNILLDVNMNAQVGDFGLARLLQDDSEHVTTRVMGTIGYLAPDYAFSGQLTEKSDVYSFGVLLLELLTGRQPVDVTASTFQGQSLVEWAWQQTIGSESINAILDPRLNNVYNPDEALCMWRVALDCVNHIAKKRPTMDKVVKLLQDARKDEHVPQMMCGTDTASVVSGGIVEIAVSSSLPDLFSGPLSGGADSTISTTFQALASPCIQHGSSSPSMNDEPEVPGEVEWSHRLDMLKQANAAISPTTEWPRVDMHSGIVPENDSVEWSSRLEQLRKDAHK
ncbi:unnamed protein product [Closterium sp. Yama58-4]|nr:unnamed protein product [Closterium sp. Yama58-4]